MDHQAYLAAAERHCERRGSKLTALRRQVLELVLRYSGVVKAYQVLADLQQERGAAAPPTVYRALDFLVEHGLLHKVDALNGFIVCDHFECQHEGLILVCGDCGQVQEIDAAPALSALRLAAQAAAFSLCPQNLVLTGRCQSCSA
ncbi:MULTISPECIES: Fur family transcriptional regulator [Chromobacterium]|uniref:Transcriptional repressor n=1 Tax=Chromobacterium haemolyticum TaxID=394935 RepID=A0A1W0CMA2_9NEIS|nr:MULTISPECIES: Fur family transcriptional regulator [Chromobacterium]OQS35869.1 transcriptional repressor [Chromobacterium haemolyticum]QOZ83331.1 transcriptional repressor [Chromobacterium sp. Rain0013]UGA36718.1 transcriptional repressor [Chromobacterium haemolyticum]WON83436.1 transcriptional repressor [Chromobacterium haemolyticum]